MKIFGILSIPGGILCKNDVLGNVFHASISGIDISLVFPLLSTNKNRTNTVGFRNRLIAPNIDKALIPNGQKIFWGCPMITSSMDSIVESVVIQVDCCELEVEDVVQKLYGKVNEWINSFRSFLQLITKQQLWRKTEVYAPGNNLQLFYDNECIKNSHSPVLTGHISIDDNFASCEDIKQAAAFASSEKELLLEYQLLLSSFKARRENKNRQAIVDACSAIEICLVNQIKNCAKDKGIASEILTEKYRTLGERFNLLTKLDSEFPELDFKEIIVTPRNNIVHNREAYPSNECTDQLIKMVEKYLQHFHKSYY